MNSSFQVEHSTFVKKMEDYCKKPLAEVSVVLYMPPKCKFGIVWSQEGRIGVVFSCQRKVSVLCTSPEGKCSVVTNSFSIVCNYLSQHYFVYFMKGVEHGIVMQ